MNERNQAIQTVSAAVPALRRIDELYAMANNISQQSTAAKVRLDSKKKQRPGSIIAALWLTVVACEAVMTLINALFHNLFLAYLGIIPTIIVCRKVYRKIKIKNRSEDETTAKALKKNEELYTEISEEIEQVSFQYNDAIAAIPRDYRYYYAVNFFENVLINGRADSMKEAINLYENHLHQMRMENANQRLLLMNEQQSRMMSEIERNTRDTAYAVNMNTAFNVLYFLSR